MKIAFKEWAVVCEALGAGRQSIILRKGGIVEEGGSFQPNHPEFLLFPTWLHQSEAGVLAEMQPLLRQMGDRSHPGKIAIRHFARVHAKGELRSLDQVRALRPFHVWSDAVVAERFERWRQSVHVMLVRVHALPQPANMDNLPRYSGCKSWVELEHEVDTDGACPVLNDNAFERLLETCPLH